MSLAIGNAWRPVSGVAELPGHMGVFELGDAQGEVLYVGFAGGRSRFGLRSSIAEALSGCAGAEQFRYEVNTAYLTRYQELVMVHRAAGRAPALPETHITFGQLTPGTDPEL